MWKETVIYDADAHRSTVVMYLYNVDNQPTTNSSACLLLVKLTHNLGSTSNKGTALPVSYLTVGSLFVCFCYRARLLTDEHDWLYCAVQIAHLQSLDQPRWSWRSLGTFVEQQMHQQGRMMHLT